MGLASLDPSYGIGNDVNRQTVLERALSAILMTPRCHTPICKSAASPVRVCFLIDSLSRAGTESQLVALIRNLNRSCVEPYLCLLRDEPDQPNRLEPPNCPVLRLGIKTFHQLTMLPRMWKFGRFLRQNRIDVLQVYFPDSTFFGVPAGWLARVPQIVRTRNNLGYSLTAWGRWIGRWCNRIVRCTIANCEECRQSLLADEGPRPESVIVLENGVDVCRFSNVPPIENRQGAPRVGMVGNLRRIKAPELLLRAAVDICNTHPNVNFHLAGEGELRPQLESIARELGLQGRFHLAGAVADVPGFLGTLDVAVLCSHSEGMSNAVLEYMAAGRPIVATAVGANRELIEDGVSGLLVPPGDVHALASAIRRLLNDRALASRLGNAARRRAVERYSREAMVSRFENFYRSLVLSDSQTRQSFTELSLAEIV